jgi:hypothetical protein
MPDSPHENEGSPYESESCSYPWRLPCKLLFSNVRRRGQFEFVTNAFRANEAPAGMKGKTDQDHMRRLQREGYQVAISAAYMTSKAKDRPEFSTLMQRST